MKRSSSINHSKGKLSIYKYSIIPNSIEDILQVHCIISGISLISKIGLDLFGWRLTNLIYSRAAVHLIGLRAHLPCIPAMVFKISPELQIFARNRILPNMRQKEECQTRAEDAKSAAHEEWVLAASVAVLAAWSVLLNDWEDVGSNKSADFPHRSGDGIVLAADRCSAGLGRY